MLRPSDEVSVPWTENYTAKGTLKKCLGFIFYLLSKECEMEITNDVRLMDYQ